MIYHQNHANDRYSGHSPYFPYGGPLVNSLLLLLAGYSSSTFRVPTRPYLARVRERRTMAGGTPCTYPQEFYIHMNITSGRPTIVAHSFTLYVLTYAAICTDNGINITTVSYAAGG
jgi:hypothetical protein